MDVLGLIEVRRDAQLPAAGPEAAEGRLGGFLHHVAQVSGELQLAGALHHVDLHGQNLAPRLGPGEAVHHADLLPLRVEGGGIGHGTQQLRKVFLCKGDSLAIAGDQPHIRLPAEGAQLALQLADAALPRVIPDHGPDSSLADPELAARQAALRHLLGQQVPQGDLQLFLVGIAGEPDELHPVQQRGGNGLRGVGGGDEQHPGEVHRDLQIMVPEGNVLLPVQHLQQGGGRVAPVVIAQLVDLVQQQQGIHGPAAGDGLDDPARHGAYVGLPVAPDVRLVPDAAKTQPRQLPVRRLGDAHSDGGLSHTGRAHQAQNLRLPVGVHLPDGERLQNPLLHLLQAEVVPLQDLPGGLHVEALLGLHAPGHFQAHVQIVPGHRRLGAAVGLPGDAVHFPEKVLAALLRQGQGLDPLAVVLQLVLLAQLVLHHPDLGPQNLLPLAPLQLLPDLALHLLLETQDLILPGQELVDVLQTLRGVPLLQDLLLLVVAEVAVVGDEVRQRTGIPALQHHGPRRVRDAAHQLRIGPEEDGGPPQQSLHPGALADLRLAQLLHVGLEVGLRLPQAAELHPAEAVHQDAHGAAAHLQDLPDGADGAHLIEVPLLRRLGANLPLGHKEDPLVPLHGLLQGPEGDLPLHVETQTHMGKNRQAPQGQDGKIPIHAFHGLSIPFSGIPGKYAGRGARRRPSRRMSDFR